MKSLKGKNIKSKSKTKNTIPIEEFKTRTTTSPLVRHLGHFHALLTLDSNSTENKISEDMWKVHNNITNVALLNEKSLAR